MIIILLIVGYILVAIILSSVVINLHEKYEGPLHPEEKAFFRTVCGIWIISFPIAIVFAAIYYAYKFTDEFIKGILDKWE